MARLLLRRLAPTAAAFLCAAATGAAAHGTGLQPVSPQTVRYWSAVASCETGSGGAPKWDWGSKHRPGEGTLFEGGLGFSAAMWKLWAGQLGILAQYPHAYYAPALVQIQVAVYGSTTQHAAWGCKG